MKINIQDYKGFFDEALEISKRHIDESERLWGLLDNPDLTDDEYERINDQASELSDSIIPGRMSMYLLSEYLDKYINRQEDEVYDVSKIHVSTNFYDYMQDYDYKLIEYQLGDIYSDSKIRGDVSMAHLFSGFVEDDSIKNDNIIKIFDNILRKNVK